MFDNKFDQYRPEVFPEIALLTFLLNLSFFEHINAPLAGLYFNIEKGKSADEEEVLLAVHKT